MQAEELLKDIYKTYSRLSSYEDNGVVSQTLTDGSGMVTISFKTLFKRPNLYYCHFDCSMPSPFQSMVTRISVGSDGKEAFLYERDQDFQSVIKRGTLSDMLTLVTAVSAGAATQVASLLMPEEVGDIGLNKLVNVIINKDDLMTNKEYYTISGAYPRGAHIRLKVSTLSSLIIETTEIFRNSIDLTCRKDIKINQHIPDTIFSLPKH